MVEYSIPSFSSLSSAFTDQRACVNYLLQVGVIPTVRNCQSCSGTVSRSPSQYKLWRCRNKSCRHSTSVFTNSLFEHSKVPCSTVLWLVWLWIGRCPISLAVSLTGVKRQTVSNIYNKISKMVANQLSPRDQIIGGQGTVVHLDESWFTAGKSERKQPLLVFGGVEDTPEARIFASVVKDRSHSTLLRCAKFHVRQGSIVVTDSLPSYNGFETGLNVTHVKVNRSQSSEVLLDGRRYSNLAIEGIWGVLKQFIPMYVRSDRELLQLWLDVEIWRHLNRHCLWDAMLASLKHSVGVFRIF
jgi:ISXO2-like transposase domain